MTCFQGYTNADNPFGDNQLLDRFVWDKVIIMRTVQQYTYGDLQKRQQDVSDFKLSKAEVERREKQRQDETRRELEKVKKRKVVSIVVVMRGQCHHVCVCVGEREGERGKRR